MNHLTPRVLRGPGRSEILKFAIVVRSACCFIAKRKERKLENPRGKNELILVKVHNNLANI